MSEIEPLSRIRERGDPARRAGWVRVNAGNHLFDYEDWIVQVTALPGDKAQNPPGAWACRHDRTSSHHQSPIDVRRDIPPPFCSAFVLDFTRVNGSQEFSAMALVGSISQQIWDMKYRLRAPADGNMPGEPLDKTIEDTWRRVASALAAPERDPA